jgi:ATP-binding cassette, subfamily F, member 3
MILLQLSGVSKSIGEEVLLRDVSLTLQDNQRLGLVGANGSGKSTLLRLIAGEWEPDSGSIDKPSGVRIGYLPQSARVSGQRPLWEELESVFEGHTSHEPYDYKIRMALHGLGLLEEHWHQATASLSGGEKCRAALARVLLQEPDILLLDEPTNHLDVEGREWLEQFLARYRGAAIIVAHDRVMLERCTTHTAFVLSREIRTYKGSFEKSRAQWEGERDRQEQAFERQQEFIAKTQAFIRKNIAGQKTKQAQSRRKMLAKLDRVEAPQKEQRGPKIRWAEAGRSRSELFRLEHATLGYPDKPLARIHQLILRRGDCIGVVGPNGAGKSTMIKTILGDLPPLTGEVRKAARTQMSYFRQEVAELHTDQSVEQHFWNTVPDWQKGQVRTYLARFLFRGDEVEKNVRGLSGGERRRLELARLTVTPAHVLILDEPTNHLDLQAQEAVEEALEDFDGSVLLVSHDRWLLDSMCEKLWVFENGLVTEHLGNYSDLVAKREAAAMPQVVKKAAPATASAPRKPDPKKEQKRLAQEVAEAESKVAELERELEQINQEGHDPATAANWARLNFLSVEKRKKERELAKWMKAWEAAAAALEALGASDGTGPDSVFGA